MKNALINPNEKIYFENSEIGQRIAQVEPDNKVFEVALPLHWIPCEDYVMADIYYFANNDTIQPNPNYSETPIDVTDTVN